MNPWKLLFPSSGFCLTATHPRMQPREHKTSPYIYWRPAVPYFIQYSFISFLNSYAMQLIFIFVDRFSSFYYSNYTQPTSGNRHSLADILTSRYSFPSRKETFIKRPYHSCVKRKNQLDATYFIIYSKLIHCSTCFGR